MEYRKVYVGMDVRFSEEGGMRPVSVLWEDGRTFSVERVKTVGRFPAHTGALLPVCYVCSIGGKMRRLYFEREKMRWFVEVPLSVFRV